MARKPDVTHAIESYKEFLIKAQAQHERTITQAYAQLQALIEQSAVVADTPKDPPQSVWVTGNDGEPLLMMNQSAAEVISDMIEKLKVIVAELAKQIEVRRN